MNYFFKKKIDNHNQIKQELLSKINLIPNNPFINDFQNILHTDYNLPKEMHREYSYLFFDIVRPHLEKITKSLNCLKYEITGFWFQQYINSGFHNWHTHGHCHFSNVYFLECPKGCETEFKDVKEDYEEGDIISFPAFIPHRSPEIKRAEDRKTIISFNTNFYIFN